jgi:hypothetical protein
MTTIETKSRIALFLTLAAAAVVQRAAHAESNTSGPVEAVTSAPSLPATLAPSDSALRYSFPWQLRPVMTESMVRIDTAAAVFNDAQGNIDIAVPTVFASSYHLTPHWAPTIRLGFVGNNAPGAAFDGTAFANPIVGATYARALGIYRLALFGATTIPLGTGGGDVPNLRAAETNAAAIAARPADAAMFAVNYMAGIAGADLAYVGHGFTAQGEMTLLQFVRVRGGDGGGATDAFRTQAAVGLHLGYFFGSHFSLSSDLNYRRWLSHPTTLGASAGARITFSDAGMNTTTVAVGPRVHFRLGRSGWIRPGVAFVRGIDARGFGAPLIASQTTAVQLDVAVTF